MNPLTTDERNALFSQLHRHKLGTNGTLVDKELLLRHGVSLRYYIRWWSLRPTECDSCRHKNEWMLGRDDVQYSCANCFTDVLAPVEYSIDDFEDGGEDGAKMKERAAQEEYNAPEARGDHVELFETLEGIRLLNNNSPTNGKITPVPWKMFPDVVKVFCFYATLRCVPTVGITPDTWSVYYTVLTWFMPTTTRFSEIRRCCQDVVWSDIEDVVAASPPTHVAVQEFSKFVGLGDIMNTDHVTVVHYVGQMLNSV
eukprot:PhF_6_TR11589/c1_g1_i2/m.18757